MTDAGLPSLLPGNDGPNSSLRGRAVMALLDAETADDIGGDGVRLSDHADD